MSKPSDLGRTTIRRAMGAAPNSSNTVRRPGSSAQALGELHLVVGPVGSGKSTYAVALAVEHQALRLTLDDWMARLFRPDRPDRDLLPWYVERAGRCVDQIWEIARDAADRSIDVVLEIGLIQRHDRERFYARVDEAALELTIHVVEAERQVRRRRVAERNRARGATFSMVVPPNIFELASDRYEPLDDAELDGRRVRHIRTDR